MDDIIKKYPFVSFGNDLNYCYKNDLMYQACMDNIVEYGEKYFETYNNRENTEIANKLNQFRTTISQKFCKKCIVDIGIGSGEFIKKSKLKVFGYDINPLGIEWLKERGLFVDPYNSRIPREIEGWTLWDTLEHIPNPQNLFKKVKEGQYLFVSLPILSNILEIRKNKHYKPNEHLYYFTVKGLIGYMNDSGFSFIEKTDAETKAGRESILSFVFRRF